MNRLKRIKCFLKRRHAWMTTALMVLTEPGSGLVVSASECMTCGKLRVNPSQPLPEGIADILWGQMLTGGAGERVINTEPDAPRKALVN